MRTRRLQISSEVDYEVPYDGVHRMWMAVILSGLREKAKCLRFRERGIELAGRHHQMARNVETTLLDLDWFFLEEEEIPCNLAWICAHLSENGDGLKKLFRDEYSKNSYACLEKRFFRNAHAGQHDNGRKKQKAPCGEKNITVLNKIRDGI